MVHENVMETDRLILRHWHTDDAEALYKYASDRRVSEMAMWPRHTSVDMSREVIEKLFAPDVLTYAVVLKATDEPIGCIGLVPQGCEHYAVGAAEREVGYWVGRPYWGHGLIPEALNAVMEYCRATLHLDSLLITMDARNKASRRVAEKCGFRFIADYDCEGIPSKAYRNRLRK